MGVAFGVEEGVVMVGVVFRLVDKYTMPLSRVTSCIVQSKSVFFFVVPITTHSASEGRGLLVVMVTTTRSSSYFLYESSTYIIISGLIMLYSFSDLPMSSITMASLILLLTYLTTARN